MHRPRPSAPSSDCNPDQAGPRSTTVAASQAGGLAASLTGPRCEIALRHLRPRMARAPLEPDSRADGRLLVARLRATAGRLLGPIVRRRSDLGSSAATPVLQEAWSAVQWRTERSSPARLLQTRPMDSRRATLICFARSADAKFDSHGVMGLRQRLRVLGGARRAFSARVPCQRCRGTSQYLRTLR